MDHCIKCVAFQNNVIFVNFVGKSLFLSMLSWRMRPLLSQFCRLIYLLLYVYIRYLVRIGSLDLTCGFKPLWYLSNSREIVIIVHIDGWAQDCDISIANVLQIPQYRTKPSIMFWSNEVAPVSVLRYQFIYHRWSDKILLLNILVVIYLYIIWLFYFAYNVNWWCNILYALICYCLYSFVV